MIRNRRDFLAGAAASFVLMLVGCCAEKDPANRIRVPATMVDPPMPPRYGGLRRYATGFESFGVNACLPDVFRRQGTADGKAFASVDGRGNKAFGTCRPDTWVRCRLEISGLGALPKCVCILTDEEGKVSRIEGSAFERQAKSLTWFGFLTPGKSGRRWYVDDIGWEMK